MPRLMSVALTTPQVEDRTKRLTRRLGWLHANPGDVVTLCPKVQGRRRRDGTVEPLRRLVNVEFVSVRREPLAAGILGAAEPQAEADLEGFPHLTPEGFIDFFCEHMRVERDRVITRIEWIYLDGPDGGDT